MKIAAYGIIFLVVLLIGLQNFGGRYGSYSIFSWGWLLIALAPVLITFYQKKQFGSMHLAYLGLLVLTILLQPVFKFHPIFVLAYSLVIIVPFLIFTFIKKNGLPINSKTKINPHIKDKCKQLIAENKLENCFETLLAEVKGEEIEFTILALQQKWNQNKREKNMNLNTNDWLAVQNAKVVNELLEILK